MVSSPVQTKGSDELVTDAIWFKFPHRLFDQGAVIALALVLAGVGMWRDVPALLITAPVLALLAIVDLRDHLLPRGFIYLALGWAVAAAASPLAALAGGAALATIYFIIWFIRPGGMGFGDVRLAWVTGALLAGNLRPYLVTDVDLSFFDVFYGGFFLPPILGGVAALVGLIIGRIRSRKSRVPLGPFLVAGAVLIMALPSGWMIDRSLAILGL